MDDTDADGPVSRRGFLRTAAGTTAVVGASGAATAQEGNESGGGGGSAETVTVGPGGQFVFEPDSLSISPGTAVEFVWESDNHNVSPTEGDWGHEPIENSGFSFTTPPFEETGTQEYVCVPHEAAGMTGTIEVSEGGGGGGGGSSGPAIPGSAKALGVATMSFMLSTLGLAYFFMRFGGDYETSTE